MKKNIMKGLCLVLSLILLFSPLGEMKGMAETFTFGTDSVGYAIYTDYRFSRYVAGTEFIDTHLTNTKGITLATNGTDAYGNAELYTNITGSYIFLPQESGKVKGVQGKVACVITNTTDKPSLEGKGNASKGSVASASIKNGVITVKAGKNPGKVYLHIIDTGSGSLGYTEYTKDKPNKIKDGAYASCLINVVAAPSKIKVTKTGDETKKVEIKDGKSVVINLKPYYVSDAGEEIVITGDEIEEPDSEIPKTVNTKDLNVGVDPKSAPYFTVSDVAADGSCTITLKALNKGKRTTGKITFTSPITNVKTTVSVEAYNPVKTINSLSTESLNPDLNISGFKVTYTTDKATVPEKVSTKLKIASTNENSLLECTDNVKLYPMAAADSFTIDTEKEKVKITGKASKEQNKIKLKLGKDKKTISVTISKGAKPTTAYYLLYYSPEKYKVVSVEVKSTAASSNP